MADNRDDRRFCFTIQRLKRIPDPPARERVDYYDTTTRGLALTVSRSKRSYYYIGRVAGKVSRVKLGTFGEISLKAARSAVADVLSKSAKGESVPRERRVRRKSDGLSLGAAWDYYLEHWAKPRKRTWKGDVSQYNKHLAVWENSSLSSIEVADVRKRHAEIGKKSPYAANRVLALLSKIIEVARKHLEYTGENVARLVDRFPEEDRERFLSADEIGRFFAALDAEEDVVAADLFRWLIWTGARKGNALSARWDELDLAAGVWTIPGSKFKNGRAQRIPLTPAALDVLERRGKENVVGCEWIFPGKDPERHREGARNAWTRICKAAELENVRIHDLRRSVGSWMAGNGVGLPIIGATLGHRTQQATAIYSRVALDPVRVALESAQMAMNAAIESHKQQKKKTTRREASSI